MDLATRYLGLDLPHPFIAGASPMARDLDVALRLEDAGASALVMDSLFEEEVDRECGTIHFVEFHAESHPEAASYLPVRHDAVLGPELYLERLSRLAERLDIPVIASLNGTTPGGWLRYARLIEQAGADALELNVYELVTDPAETGAAVEERVLEMLVEVKRLLGIPVTVKLSPFYSALAHFARRLDECGADGLVLFNRFYQSDIDPEGLEVVPVIRPATSTELLLRLRWLAILSDRLSASLAVSGGVNTALDAVKAAMAGADVIQLVGVLLRRGPEYLAALQQGLAAWMEEHGYGRYAALRGCMSLARCPDPSAFERTQYMEVLRSWEDGV